MQPAELPYLLNPRPQIQVVSVSEKNLDAQFLQQILRDALYGSLGANWHEYGGFNCAVRRGQLPPSGRTSGCLDFEFQRHSEVILKVTGKARADGLSEGVLFSAYFASPSANSAVKIF